MDCSKGSSTRPPKGSSAESLNTSSDILSRCNPDGAAGHRNRLAHPSISNFDCQKALLLTFQKLRNRLRLQDLRFSVSPPFDRQTYYLTCLPRGVKASLTSSCNDRESNSTGPLRARAPRCARSQSGGGVTKLSGPVRRRKTLFHDTPNGHSREVPPHLIMPRESSTPPLSHNSSAP